MTMHGPWFGSATVTSHEVPLDATVDARLALASRSSSCSTTAIDVGKRVPVESSEGGRADASAADETLGIISDDDPAGSLLEGLSAALDRDRPKEGRVNLSLAEALVGGGKHCSDPWPKRVQRRVSR
mmetsp:Transcript_86876/g.173477  ORF Transcript_86876/g.173477 Transcript_86876/m.173477 type:complete len:127 (+) Transcript_86876:404-784(+)